MNEPRDFFGYGRQPPLPHWPADARIAVSFVLNYEEGGERSVLDGDAHAETFLSDMQDPAPFPARHLSMESLYEYGSRAGVWRLLRLFASRGVPLTVFAVARALERNPLVAAAFVEAGHEVAGHGLRWLPYQEVPEETERAHLIEAVDIFRRLLGAAPHGWYTGRDSVNTRRLVVEHGGFLYDSDSYADDLPYWVRVEDKQHLVVPYALDTNDMRFANPAGFGWGAAFFEYLRDAFDTLYSEGEHAPKMMSVGLHCRLVGRPGRTAALARFLDHVQAHEKVWVARRVDIAQHWRSLYPSA
jgi:putative urate catabolism protein